MNTEFEEAVQSDELEVVRRMLQAKPELIQERAGHGMTALMLAVGGFERSVATVQLLLDAGAEIGAQNAHGYTALHCVIDVVDGSGASEENTLGIMERLLAAGAQLEARQCYGWTPLMQAVLRGEAYEVRALLAAGANPNVLFPQHSLPTFVRGRSLLAASTVADLEVTKLLLAAGADVQARDEYGQTALDWGKQMKRVSGSEPGNFAEKLEEYAGLLRAAGAT